MIFATWKPVSGYEDRYLVSDDGRVFSFFYKNFIKRRPNRYGYLEVQLAPRPYWTVPVHTLVLNAFVGLRPEGMEARHLDGDRTNPRLDNLVWGTNAENHEDRERHGTVPKGEQVHGAKLTAEQVLAIRSDFRRLQDIADEYGVCRSAICLARSGKNWRHL